MNTLSHVIFIQLASISPYLVWLPGDHNRFLRTFCVTAELLLTI
jgi:hypothetical protein